MEYPSGHPLASLNPECNTAAPDTSHSTFIRNLTLPLTYHHHPHLAVTTNTYTAMGYPSGCPASLNPECNTDTTHSTFIRNVTRRLTLTHYLSQSPSSCPHHQYLQPSPHHSHLPPTAMGCPAGYSLDSLNPECNTAASSSLLDASNCCLRRGECE